MPKLGLGLGLPYNNGIFFTPRSLSDLAFWYDPYDLSTLTIDGSNRVSLWADKSPWSRVNELVLPGSNGNHATLPTGVSIGTGAFTMAWRIRVPLSVSTAAYVGGISSTLGNSAVALGTEISLEASGGGTIRVLLYAASSSNFIYQDFATALVTGYAGQVVTLTIVRPASGTIKCYVNGVASTLGTGGSGASPPTWQGSITSTYLNMGVHDGSNFPYSGNIQAVRCYSAALTDAEVLSDANGTLQSGLTVNSDYRLATKMASSFVCQTGQTVTINTSGATGARISGARDLYQGTVANQPVYIPSAAVISQAATSAITNNAAGFDSLTGATATGVTFNASTAGAKNARTNGGSVSIYPGQRVTVTFNAVQNSGSIGQLACFMTGNGDASAILSDGVSVVAGANSFVLTCTTYAPDAGLMFRRGNGGTDVNATISDIVVSIEGIDSPSLRFDGSNDFLKSAGFPFVQPETVQGVFSQVSWTGSDTIFDGNADDGMRLLQFSASPGILAAAGGAGTSLNSGWPIGESAVVSSGFNGSSSFTRINRSAAVSGDAGSNNANGFTLGAEGSASLRFSNITAGEIIGRSSLAAMSTYEQDRVINYLLRRARITP